MILYGKNLILRDFKNSDKQTLAQLCNNKNIWNNVRDYIPFPYTEEDAILFIHQCRKEQPQFTFAIEKNNELVGSIGLIKQTDVYKISAEIGYWIGEKYWGQGIATNAVKIITQYGFEQLNLKRIYTGVFDFNKASQKVLTKAGFELECIFKSALIKNDVICDEYRYSKIKN